MLISYLYPSPPRCATDCKSLTNATALTHTIMLIGKVTLYFNMFTVI